MTTRRIVLFCMLVTLVGGAAVVGAFAGGAAVYLAARNQLEPITASPAAATAPAATISPVSAASAPRPSPQPSVVVPADQSTAVEQAVAKVGPAVVTVVNDLGSGQQASGSGVIISATVTLSPTTTSLIRTSRCR